MLDLQGQAKPGWPVTPANANFSYQSPLLVDLTGDNKLEIISCAHGTAPHITVFDYQGQTLSGWPNSFPNWTYSPPTAIDTSGNGHWLIFAGIAGGPVAGPTLYAYETSGQTLPNFPIVKAGGAEGFISVADVDNDGDFEVLVDNNLTDMDGLGFLHAFKMDGSEVPGFPLRPTGWTYLNGAELADLNNDGLLDVVAVSYNDQFTYINAWSLGVPYQPDNVLFGTYHGNLARDGLIPPKIPTGIADDSRGHPIKDFALSVFPNPMNPISVVRVQLPRSVRIALDMFDITGRRVRTLHRGELIGGKHRFRLDGTDLSSGVYLINLRIDGQHSEATKIILLK